MYTTHHNQMTPQPTFLNTIRDNSTLSISSPLINSCQDVAEYLKQCQIACHVTSNYTVVPGPIADEYITETGCQIKFGSHHPCLINPLFWKKLQNKFKLNCAHLEVEGKFKGCIYDYFRNPQCPNKSNARMNISDTQ